MTTMDWKAHLPLIAILRGVTPDEVEAHVDALIAAGITLIEIPTNSPHWLRSVERAQGHARGRAIIGAGTVLNAADVDALATTGAKLMVTPNTDPPLIRHAVAAGLTVAAGFLTPSEAFAALGAGAQILKLFPAANMGSAYVRAIKAVLPSTTPLFAVGGVTPENLRDFLGAGCSGAGLGGDLYKPGQLSTATRSRAEAFIRSYGKK
ncbi:2-dehydro-3-deoxy-6-phosphogalactonate aldolase [Rudaea sp.]|uniref:2-dehydro-3-deoxy-6-phosphogalactonate aldolase n=1 Tax=Rudaea sp. TaxID=2136325 RepID=UPI0037836CB6